MENGKSSFGIVNRFGDFLGQTEQNVLNTKTIFPKCTAPYGQKILLYLSIFNRTNERMHPLKLFCKNVKKVLDFCIKLCYHVDTAEEHGNNLKGVFTYEPIDHF